jgi:tetratricopeptide (TPR) repeat protein
MQSIPVVRLAAPALLLLLAGCATAPQPLTQPSTTMGLTEARKVATAIGSVCDSPSLSCIIFRREDVRAVSAGREALVIDRQPLPYADMHLAIVRAQAENKFAFLVLRPGLVAETGYGEAGNRNAQKLADALLTLAHAERPEVRAAEKAQFDAAAAQYRSAATKPDIGEEVRRYEVQAEDAVHNKDFERAAGLYESALQLAPWWPQGHFNRALLLESLEQYDLAIEEMQHYLALVPDAPNARAAQDKIYAWQGKLAP